MNEHLRLINGLKGDKDDWKGDGRRLKGALGLMEKSNEVIFSFFDSKTRFVAVNEPVWWNETEALCLFGINWWQQSGFIG